MGSDILALLPHDEADQEKSGGEELFRRGYARAVRLRRNRQDRRTVRRQDSAHPWRAGAGGSRTQGPHADNAFELRKANTYALDFAVAAVTGFPPMQRNQLLTVAVVQRLSVVDSPVVNGSRRL